MQEKDLCLSQAKAFVLAIEKHDFVSIDSIYRIENGNEYIEILVDVECPQYPKNDVRLSEILGVEFQKEDTNYPNVFALREDFPLVPHLNMMSYELPRCLCIYEQPFYEQNALWNQSKFIEDIRLWLNRTAKGELHQEEQGLEPFIITGGKLIIPRDLNGNDTFSLHRTNKDGSWVLVAKKQENKVSNGFQLAFFESSPSEHGIISHTPLNLKELIGLCSKIGIDLKEYIEILCKGINSENGNINNQLVLFLRVPLKRHKDSSVETYNNFAFVVDKSQKEIGLITGLCAEANGDICPILLSKLDIENCSSIGVFPLRIVLQINDAEAAAYNGIEHEKSRFSMIGVGALGSQILLNCARSSFGLWHLIDNDYLLPHNLARHALFSGQVGLSKSEATNLVANNVIAHSEFSSYTHAEIQNIENDATLLKVVQDSKMVIDTSASLATARFISDKLENRLCSIFLNPCGTDLIILCEDEERSIPLTCLEMQYYKFILSEDSLASHLSPVKGIGYVASCRDKSNIMSQDQIAVHAGIASKKIKQLSSENIPFGGIWKIEDDCSVHFHPIPLSSIVELHSNEWQIYTDTDVIKRLKQARQNKLPVETGGILLGTFDLPNKVVYIVDFISAPDDSIECPTSFLRGIEGISEKLDSIEKITARNIEYVGEWHSHPKNVSASPSADDKKMFSWINETMQSRGYPPIMLIISDNHTNFFIDKI